MSGAPPRRLWVALVGAVLAVHCRKTCSHQALFNRCARNDMLLQGAQGGLQNSIHSTFINILSIIQRACNLCC